MAQPLKEAKIPVDKEIWRLAVILNRLAKKSKELILTKNDIQRNTSAIPDAGEGEPDKISVDGHRKAPCGNLRSTRPAEDIGRDQEKHLTPACSPHRPCRLTPFGLLHRCALRRFLLRTPSL